MPATRQKRLSREESKAQTRERLISVGLQHFLQYGLRASTAEQISEDAGYSRGALYSNFDDKEDLFLEVVGRGYERQSQLFTEILKEKDVPGEYLAAKLRSAFADLVKDEEFYLVSELQSEALRNEKLRRRYLSIHKDLVRNGRRIVDDMLKSTDIRLHLEPTNFIMAMHSYVHGLAVQQKLLGPQLSQERMRAMIFSVYDSLVYRVPPQEVKKNVRRKTAKTK